MKSMQKKSTSEDEELVLQPLYAVDIRVSYKRKEEERKSKEAKKRKKKKKFSPKPESNKYNTIRTSAEHWQRGKRQPQLFINFPPTIKRV